MKPIRPIIAGCCMLTFGAVAVGTSHLDRMARRHAEALKGPVTHVALAASPAVCDDVPAPQTEVLPVVGSDKMLVLRCQVIEIDLDHLPPELTDQLSQDMESLKEFGISGTDAWKADIQADRQLLRTLIASGAATIVAEPEVIAAHGQRQEFQIVTIVPAVNNPLGRNASYVSCALSAEPRCYDGRWVMAFELTLSDPDYGSPQLLLPPAVPGFVGLAPAIPIPSMTNTGMTTTLSVEMGKTSELGGMISNWTYGNADGSTTSIRTERVVLLTAEEFEP